MPARPSIPNPMPPRRKRSRRERGAEVVGWCVGMSGDSSTGSQHPDETQTSGSLECIPLQGVVTDKFVVQWVQLKLRVGPRRRWRVGRDEEPGAPGSVLILIHQL